MTIFGPSWQDLQLEHIRSFLAGEEAEALLWEAKGTQLDPHELRKQVCAFANSHDGGYLILGATQTESGWNLDGMDFPDEPPVWVTNTLGDGRLNPYPDGLDVHAWAAGDDRHVAVVRVPPIATPPCNASGTVYERVSGKTIPVRESLRLAELFARGDSAHAAGKERAHQAARDAYEHGKRLSGYSADHVQFGLGLAAIGYQPDVSLRLFSEAFQEALFATVETLEGEVVRRPFGPQVTPYVTQDSRRLEIQAARSHTYSWIVRATCNGALGVYWTTDSGRSDPQTIVRNALKPAWSAVDALLERLAPRGSRYLQLIVNQGAHARNSDQHRAVYAHVVRGPLQSGVDAEVLASIERELRRATGEMAYEEAKPES
jgi:hypothetical protein